MIADRLAVDDRSKGTAEIAHMVTAVAFFDDKVVARQPERRDIIELEVWFQRRRLFPIIPPPANDEGREPSPIGVCNWRCSQGVLAARYALVSET